MNFKSNWQAGIYFTGVKIDTDIHYWNLMFISMSETLTFMSVYTNLTFICKYNSLTLSCHSWRHDHRMLTSELLVCLQASAMQPSVNPSPQSSQPQVTSQPNTPNNQSQAAQIDRHVPASNDFLRHQPPPPAFRAPPEFHPPFFTNGNGLFRPGFPAGYQHPAHHHPPVIQHSIQTNAVQNGEFGKFNGTLRRPSNKDLPRFHAVMWQCHAQRPIATFTQLTGAPSAVYTLT